MGKESQSSQHWPRTPIGNFSPIEHEKLVFSLLHSLHVGLRCMAAFWATHLRRATHSVFALRQEKRGETERTERERENCCCSGDNEMTNPVLQTSMTVPPNKNKYRVPSIYDVRKILGFFDPLPPLSAFGTDLQY